MIAYPLVEKQINEVDALENCFTHYTLEMIGSR